MIVGTSRDEAERALVGALSRHIGYTTAAYDLDRIFGILDMFADNTSAYESDIVAFLKSRTPSVPARAVRGAESGYVREVLSFATSMRILEIVSERNTRIKRYAPTQTGRAIMGARAAGDDAFFGFFRTKLVLFADADALVPVVLLSQRGLLGQRLFAEYRRYLFDLRLRRLTWLRTAFSERLVFDRFVDRLPWVSRSRDLLAPPQIEEIAAHTARHHVTPRRRWLVQLGLTTAVDGPPTEFGKDVLDSLLHNGKYFWLGPDGDVQAGLRIPPDKRQAGPFEDALGFRTQPGTPSDASIDALVDETATLMMEAYPRARFVYSPQAPLVLPVEYIAYRAYADCLDYPWRNVLELVFKRYRHSLERFSARRGPIGFYTVKRSH